jgi:hypothetical protein
MADQNPDKILPTTDPTEPFPGIAFPKFVKFGIRNGTGVAKFISSLNTIETNKPKMNSTLIKDFRKVYPKTVQYIQNLWNERKGEK